MRFDYHQQLVFDKETGKEIGYLVPTENRMHWRVFLYDDENNTLIHWGYA